MNDSDRTPARASKLDLPGPDDPVAWNYVQAETLVVGPNGEDLGRVAAMLGTETEGIFHGVAVTRTPTAPPESCRPMRSPASPRHVSRSPTTPTSSLPQSRSSRSTARRSAQPPDSSHVGRPSGSAGQNEKSTAAPRAAHGSAAPVP